MGKVGLEDSAGPYVGLLNNEDSRKKSKRTHLSFLVLSILLVAACVAILTRKTQLEQKREREQKQEQEQVVYTISRGPADGVSEKSVRIPFSSSPYPWTNAELRWQRTGFHFQPQKNWMNGIQAPPFSFVYTLRLELCVFVIELTARMLGFFAGHACFLRVGWISYA